MTLLCYMCYLMNIVDTSIYHICNPLANSIYYLVDTIITIFFQMIFYPATTMHLLRRKVRYKSRITKRSWKWKLRPILTYSLLSMSSTTRYHHVVAMDNDAEAIGIDNGASACISHQVDDFIGDPHDSNRVIVGYNGSKTRNLKTGTLRWNWTDDTGMAHSHIIPNSFYSPEGGVRLLSPQHWSQATCKNRKVKHPPSCITTGRHVILQWGNNKYRKTIPLGIIDKVAKMYSDPGYDRFHAFCAEADISSNDNYNIIICDECTSVLEDNDDEQVSATTKLTYPINKSTSDDHFNANIETNDTITS